MAQMNWKGNCIQLQVRNVRGVALVSLTFNDSASVTFQIDIKATKDYGKANIVPEEITLVIHDPSKRKVLDSARLKVGQR